MSNASIESSSIVSSNSVNLLALAYIEARWLRLVYSMGLGVAISLPSVVWACLSGILEDKYSIY